MVLGRRLCPISVRLAIRPPTGVSGGPAVSGDNRKTRLAAFHSAASNLVRHDTNRKTDVFVWRRPRGRRGLRLTRLTGKLLLASISSRWVQGNGSSTNPSLDGSLTSRPHCVAFQSTSTNLDPADADAVSDIFVRDLRTNRTHVVSGSVDAPATNPSIDGHCRRVAFQAGGWIWVAKPRGGFARR